MELHCFNIELDLYHHTMTLFFMLFIRKNYNLEVNVFPNRTTTNDFLTSTIEFKNKKTILQAKKNFLFQFSDL